MVTLMGVSVLTGFFWDHEVWLIAAAIFYAVWVLAYTTFFTNMGGIESGMWRGLGYWIAQQDVARGNQPWYYYFVITPLYEFLPLALSVAAAVYYAVKRRTDAFTLFLLYWCGMTLLLFTIASEKMPWLLVNITLPLIVLAGKFLGEIVCGVDWRKLASMEGALVVVGTPILMVAVVMLALAGTGDSGNGLAVGIASALACAAILGVGWYISRQIKPSQMAKIAAIPAVVVLLALTVRASGMAAYSHGDVPVEMLVYTQTSPDIRLLADEIYRADGFAGADNGIAIDVDDTSGFTWPWAWYLRDSDEYHAAYRAIDENTTPDGKVVIVHSNNENAVAPMLAATYGEGQRIKHRWWFPEHTYRNITPSRFVSGITDRETWRSVVDYWLNREGVRHNIGSEDAYVFFAPDFPQDYQPIAATE